MLELSPLGLGCNNLGMKLDRDESAAVVHAALDAGITHFDTAEMYGGGESEEHLGAAIGTWRDEVVLATKFLPRAADQPYEPGVLAQRIREGCETSLRRLGTDRIDLYYQHYPDTDAGPDEAIEALEALVADGKVLHLGTSNVDAEQIRSIRDRVAVTQIEWNLLARQVEAEIVPAARDVGIGVIPYFPLASGLLTGKYRRGEAFPSGSRLDTMPYFSSVATDDNFVHVERLTSFAEQRGRTILELAVAWLLAQPGVASVICGATSPAQVAANAAAAGWALTPAEVREIDDLLREER